MSNLSRCLAYLDKLPPAQSGSGGHSATFRAACECVRFGLTDGEAWEALSWYNDNRCSPKWTQSELRHKLNEAQKIAKAGERAGGAYQKRGGTFTPPTVIPKMKINFASIPEVNPGELLQADELLQVPEVNPDELLLADEWGPPTDDGLQLADDVRPDSPTRQKVELAEVQNPESAQLANGELPFCRHDNYRQLPDGRFLCWVCHP